MRPDGTLATWGVSDNWQTTGPPPDGIPFSKISLGRTHACGLDLDGLVHCWGTGYYGEPFPPGPSGAFAQIESWRNMTCAIDALGSMTCWWGWVPDEAWNEMAPTDPMASVGLGEWGACGVSLLGQAYCWGMDPAHPWSSWMNVPQIGPP